VKLSSRCEDRGGNGSAIRTRSIKPAPRDEGGVGRGDVHHAHVGSVVPVSAVVECATRHSGPAVIWVVGVRFPVTSHWRSPVARQHDVGSCAWRTRINGDTIRQPDIVCTRRVWNGVEPCGEVVFNRR
jgi:hypothetical protein